jgi:predicted PurR-regulated permease PerM
MRVAGGEGLSKTVLARRREFLFRLAATTTLVLALLVIWNLAHFLFLAFGGVLLAVFLNAPARLISDRTRMPYKLALLLVIVTLLGLAAIAGWILAPSVTRQFNEMADRLPAAIDRITQQLQKYDWIDRVVSRTADTDTKDIVSSGGKMVSRLGKFLVSAVDAVTGTFVVLVIGIFLSASPPTYTEGIQRLVPIRHREEAGALLNRLGRTLRNWLIGQAISMTVIAVLTSVGLAIIGVPLWLALGVIAGLLEFIPTFGPILSFVPAILIAFTESPERALQVIALYIGIQIFESNLLMPMVQRHAVKLPPVVTILTTVTLSALFGFLGMLLATPLAAVSLVLIHELYVRKTLGDSISDLTTETD